jgi:hypothetical protein
MLNALLMAAMSAVKLVYTSSFFLLWPQGQLQDILIPMIPLLYKPRQSEHLSVGHFVTEKAR